MITLAASVSDRIDAGQTPEEAGINDIPAWQFGPWFSTLSKHCPNRLEPDGLPNQCNALRVEIVSPCARCIMRYPGREKMPDRSPSSYLMSGGPVSAYGACELANCPRAQTGEFSYSRWQHEDTGRICELPKGKYPGPRWIKINATDCRTEVRGSAHSLVETKED